MSEYQTIEGELMAMEISLQDAVLERVHYDLYNEVEWDLEYVIDDDIAVRLTHCSCTSGQQPRLN